MEGRSDLDVGKADRCSDLRFYVQYYVYQIPYQIIQVQELPFSFPVPFTEKRIGVPV